MIQLQPQLFRPNLPPFLLFWWKICAVPTTPRDLLPDPSAVFEDLRRRSGRIMPSPNSYRTVSSSNFFPQRSSIFLPPHNLTVSVALTLHLRLSPRTSAVSDQPSPTSRLPRAPRPSCRTPTLASHVLAHSLSFLFCSICSLYPHLRRFLPTFLIPKFTAVRAR